MNKSMAKWNVPDSEHFDYRGDMTLSAKKSLSTGGVLLYA